MAKVAGSAVLELEHAMASLESNYLSTISQSSPLANSRSGDRRTRENESTPLSVKKTKYAERAFERRHSEYLLPPGKQGISGMTRYSKKEVEYCARHGGDNVNNDNTEFIVVSAGVFNEKNQNNNNNMQTSTITNDMISTNSPLIALVSSNDDDKDYANDPQRNSADLNSILYYPSPERKYMQLIRGEEVGEDTVRPHALNSTYHDILSHFMSVSFDRSAMLSFHERKENYNGSNKGKRIRLQPSCQ